MKADTRTAKRFKARYGHFGAGASHTREGSEAETRHHVKKIKTKQSPNSGK